MPGMYGRPTRHYKARLTPHRTTSSSAIHSSPQAAIDLPFIARMGLCARLRSLARSRLSANPANRGAANKLRASPGWRLGEWLLASKITETANTTPKTARYASLIGLPATTFHRLAMARPSAYVEVVASITREMSPWRRLYAEPAAIASSIAPISRLDRRSPCHTQIRSDGPRSVMKARHTPHAHHQCHRRQPSLCERIGGGRVTWGAGKYAPAWGAPDTTWRQQSSRVRWQRRHR